MVVFPGDPVEESREWSCGDGASSASLAIWSHPSITAKEFEVKYTAYAIDNGHVPHKLAVACPSFPEAWNSQSGTRVSILAVVDTAAVLAHLVSLWP